ncbi:hypothetical protein JNUCC83_03525 [Vagococcus sp. JNUCC 83]
MKKKRALVVIAWVVLSLLYLLPIIDLSGLHFAIIRGDDYPFHFSRIFSAIDQLSKTESIQALGRFGEHDIFYGANIFYPTLTTVLPIAGLTMLFHSVVAGVYVYLFFMNVLTFYIAYCCSNYICQLCFTNENSRLKILTPYVFSVFYVFSHYRMICFYQRFDLGEFFVLSMYPLVFAGFYSIIKDKGNKKHWLIIGMTLIAYSHLLSLMLVVVVLAILFLISLIRKKLTFNIVKQFLISAVMTGFLSSGALLPIVYEMITFPIRSVSVHDLSKEASDIIAMIENSSINNLTYTSIGFMLLSSLIVAVIQIIFKHESIVKRLPIVKQSLVASLILLVMTTKLFPWRIVQHTPLSIIQFPFRLMPFLTLFGSFLGAVLLSDYLSHNEKSSTKKWVISLSLFLVVMSTISVNELMIRRSLGTLMFGEQDIVTTKRYQKSVNKDYFPAGLSETQTKRIKNKIGLLNQKEVLMPYTFEKDSVLIELTTKDKVTNVVTPIIGYSGLVIRDETGNQLKTMLSSGKTLSFILPRGHHKLFVYYDPPFIIKYSSVFSMVIAVMYAIYLFKNRKKSGTEPKR